MARYFCFTAQSKTRLLPKAVREAQLSSCLRFVFNSYLKFTEVVHLYLFFFLKEVEPKGSYYFFQIMYEYIFLHFKAKVNRIIIRENLFILYCNIIICFHTLRLFSCIRKIFKRQSGRFFMNYYSCSS